MSEHRSRKRSFQSEVHDYHLFTAPKRRRSRSLGSTVSLSSGDLNALPMPFQPPPPSAYDLDRLDCHITLQAFSDELQSAANAIFPTDPSNLSRYSEVDVILLSWEEEDPNLPVSIEIKELAKTFEEQYGFNVQEWLIPGENCHNRLQSRILQFLDENDAGHLKIVYYAGHGKLTNHGQPAWTSFRNRRKERCPTVKWSGIQNTLEESQSDVLILLDCCSSGVATTDEGNGVTELIAACAYDAIANGVGPFSFTRALNTKLRQMARLPSFTVGFLYNAVFTEIQGWVFDDPKHRKIPVHLVLSQTHERSIRLSNFSKRKGKQQAEFDRQTTPPLADEATNVRRSETASASETLEQFPPQTGGASPFSPLPSNPSSETSLSSLPEYPRLLFSIRLTDNIRPNDLSVELFSDWLRSFPASANFVKVEAGFVSNSTLLLLSVPPAMLGFLKLDPAITLLGTVHSKNIVGRHMDTPAEVRKSSTVTVDKSHLSIPTFWPTPSSVISPLGSDTYEGLSDGQQLYYRPPQSTDDFIYPPRAAYQNTSPGPHPQFLDNPVALGQHDLMMRGTLGGVEWDLSVNDTSSHLPVPEVILIASPDRKSSSAASTPVANETDDMPSAYSLPIDTENQVILAKMRPAHLSLNGPMFGEDIPEDIGYEIYKLGTLVQALRSRPEKFNVDYSRDYSGDSAYWP